MLWRPNRRPEDCGRLHPHHRGLSGSSERARWRRDPGGTWRWRRSAQQYERCGAGGSGAKNAIY